MEYDKCGQDVPLLTVLLPKNCATDCQILPSNLLKRINMRSSTGLGGGRNWGRSGAASSVLPLFHKRGTDFNFHSPILRLGVGAVIALLYWPKVVAPLYAQSLRLHS